MQLRAGEVERLGGLDVKPVLTHILFMFMLPVSDFDFDDEECCTWYCPLCSVSDDYFIVRYVKIYYRYHYKTTQVSWQLLYFQQVISPVSLVA